MARVRPTTKLEQIAGSLPVEVAATVIGALHGGAIAPLLPVLSKSLASRRQLVRIEDFLREVEGDLRKHEELLFAITDAQYKLINEAVAAAFQTTHDAKLQYLRATVANAIRARNIDDQDASILARVIRDISAEEAAFLVRNYSYKLVHISSSPTEDAEVLSVDPKSRDSFIVGSLAALGVLTVGEPTYGQQLRFSSWAGKLLVLLQRDA
jgi:hypothetical protein